MRRLHDASQWNRACYSKLNELKELHPTKLMYLKFISFEDGALECMLMNSANEEVSCIGEWNNTEKGVIYDVTLTP